MLRQEQRGHKERVAPQFHNPHLPVFIKASYLKAAPLDLPPVFRVQAEVAAELFGSFLVAIGAGRDRSREKSHAAPLPCDRALQAADQKQ
jgi:hypothetical protein